VVDGGEPGVDSRDEGKQNSYWRGVVDFGKLFIETQSVRPSVCPVDEHHAGKRYRLTAAGALQVKQFFANSLVIHIYSYNNPVQS